MTTPSQAPHGEPSRDRAIHALERAAACAEQGVADRPVVLIEAADLAALAATDVRALLDRVMLGQYADEGLDSLLATGVLDSILPEVKAMVGFGNSHRPHHTPQ